MKTILFLLILLTTALPEIIYSTNKVSGDKVVIYADYFMGTICIDSVYSIALEKDNLIIRTKDKRIINFKPNNISGYEIIKD
jgi:hypothetical protein